MTNIREIWSEQESQTGNKVLKYRIEGIEQLNCFVGTILVSKAKIFLLEVDSGVEIHQSYLKKFTGVDIQFLPSHNGTQELLILLLENDLTDIFTMFIEDVIETISSVTSSEEAVFLISRRVSYWKRLFGKFYGGLLSPQEQRGLYGELVMLKEFLENTSRNINVIEAWQGPFGTNQDFYFNNTAIEVKTSKSNTAIIKISNEFQLDTAGFENLFLSFLRLSELPNGENTLLKLINEIRFLLENYPEFLAEFNQKLVQLNVTSDTENEYDKTGYTIRSTLHYKVGKDFPKIISSMIDSAISHISYEISPNECKEFEISFDTILKDVINAKPKH